MKPTSEWAGSATHVPAWSVGVLVVVSVISVVDIRGGLLLGGVDSNMNYNDSSLNKQPDPFRHPQDPIYDAARDRTDQ